MRQTFPSPDERSRGPQLGDAARIFARSSRATARAARTRFGTELVKWPHRHEFDAIWTTVNQIPGWFHEGSAAALYGVIRELRPQTVVEIGSYLGRSSVFFALSLREARAGGHLVAIDPHTGDRQQLEGLAAGSLPSFDLFREHCRAAGVEDLIDARVATSLDAAADWSGPSTCSTWMDGTPMTPSWPTARRGYRTCLLTASWSSTTTTPIAKCGRQ